MGEPRAVQQSRTDDEERAVATSSDIPARATIIDITANGSGAEVDGTNDAHGPPDGARPGVARPPSRRRIVATLALCVAVVAVAGASGFAWSATRPKVYGARASIQYNVGTDTNLNATDRSLAAQAVAVRSRSVLQPVATSTGVPIDELEADVHATLVTGTNIIDVEVDHAQRDTALRALSGIVAQYLSVANVRDVGPVQSYVSDQIDQINRRLQQIQTQLNLLPATATFAEVNALTTEQSGLLDQRSKLTEASAQASISQLGTSRAVVLTAPYALTDPVAPKPVRSAAIAGLAGAVVAAACAYFLLRRPMLR